jgi:hypothetical protein
MGLLIRLSVFLFYDGATGGSPEMKALRRTSFLILCALFCGATAYTQLSPWLQQLRNISFDHITSEQGLPSSSVLSIIEDDRASCGLELKAD